MGHGALVRASLSRSPLHEERLHARVADVRRAARVLVPSPYLESLQLVGVRLSGRRAVAVGGRRFSDGFEVDFFERRNTWRRMAARLWMASVGVAALFAGISGRGLPPQAPAEQQGLPPSWGLSNLGSGHAFSTPSASVNVAGTAQPTPSASVTAYPTTAFHTNVPGFGTVNYLSTGGHTNIPSAHTNVSVTSP
ncbi:MAG: hypothetical protein FJX76_19490 [Armatimonadetes bacterium]|nr:hypothetical protein [Armatimonadota bacterium]